MAIITKNDARMNWAGIAEYMGPGKSRASATFPSTMLRLYLLTNLIRQIAPSVPSSTASSALGTRRQKRAILLLLPMERRMAKKVVLALQHPVPKREREEDQRR